MITRIVVALFAVLVCSVALADERILGYDIEVRIDKSGALDVTERITVRAEGSNIRRGIYRDFPTRYRDRYGNRVVVALQVISLLRNDEPEPWFTEERDNGGRINVPGDWHETMSTHWFHDHMFEHTAENVYKGNAAMCNIYSGLDRGNETINDGVNLRLPSGKAKDFGNLEYDVNLMLADKAFDADGQLVFDIFDRNGFLYHGRVRAVADAARQAGLEF